MKRWMPRFLAAVTMLSVLGGFGGFASVAGMRAAFAQPNPGSTLTPEQRKKVAEHHDKATRLYYVGKYDEALAEYQKAYLVSADPAMLYNIGQCHRLAGRPAEAARFYKNYLRVAKDPPNRAAVEAQIADMEKLANEQGATESAPPPAQAPPTTTPPETTPPEPSELESESMVGPPPEFPATTPPPVEAPPPAMDSGADFPPLEDVGMESSHGPSRIVPISLLVGGGVLLATSVVFGASAKAKANDLGNLARQRGAFNQEAMELERQGKAANALAVISGLLGVATSVTGVVLLMRSGGSSTDSSSDYRQGDKTSARLFPLFGKGVAGAGAQVTF